MNPNDLPHLRERECAVTRPGEWPDRPELEVRAFDFTPIPYDPIEAAKLPPAEYDCLEVYGSYSNERVVLKLDSLDNLISALTELRQALNLRETALAQIRAHDAADRDYATMTDECEAAVQAVAAQLGREFDPVWDELVTQSRHLARS